MKTQAAVFRANAPKQLKGYHVLLWMMAFFGLMFVVNGYFLFYAITTFPGEDVEKSYLQGLDYNSTLSRRAEQAKLGWTSEIGVVGSTLEIRAFEGSGLMITGKQVDVVVRRLATTADDQILIATETAPGIYTVDVSALPKGEWEIVARVRPAPDSEPVFEARKQVYVS